MIAVICGGVGAARYLAGLQQVVDPTTITAVVNTGDDLTLHGLRICPDLDTITYTLAGAIDSEQGWGLAGETWQAMDALARYEPAAPSGSGAGTTWFRLGDRDLATHLFRTARLAEGAGLAQVTREITTAWGLGLRALPATEDPLATRITVAGEGEVAFQDYFVRLRHAVAVEAVRIEGAGSASPGPGVSEALGEADRIVMAPSNPVVSIGPVLAVTGIRERLLERRADVVAVSPIVAGAALKGPADRLLEDLGHERSVVGVARLYREVASTLVVDHADAELAERVEAEGIRCVVAPTIMHGLAEAAALAKVTLA